MDLRSHGLFDGKFGNNNTLAFMTYIIDLDAYELHSEDEKVFNKFFNECQGFTL